MTRTYPTHVCVSPDTWPTCGCEKLQQLLKSPGTKFMSPGTNFTCHSAHHMHAALPVCLRPLGKGADTDSSVQRQAKLTLPTCVLRNFPTSLTNVNNVFEAHILCVSTLRSLKPSEARGVKIFIRYTKSTAFFT